MKFRKVSNVRDDGSIAAEMDLHTLHLKSNMLWHTDSTFLPVPALANIITAKIVTATGGATEIASSRAAWADMPEKLKTTDTKRRRFGIAIHTLALRFPKN